MNSPRYPVAQLVRYALKVLVYAICDLVVLLGGLATVSSGPNAATVKGKRIQDRKDIARPSCLMSRLKDELRR